MSLGSECMVQMNNAKAFVNGNESFNLIRKLRS